MHLPEPEAHVAPLAPRDLALGLGPLVAGLGVGLLTNADGSRWYRRLAKPAWTTFAGLLNAALARRNPDA